MNIIQIPIGKLTPAFWNPNEMDGVMEGRLRNSLSRFGQVENLVCRPTGDGMYEVVSGNHRLKILTDIGISSVPCVVLNLNDAEVRLLAQALNRVQGEDDIGIKAELVREILEGMSREEALSILPETASSLSELETLGQEDLAEHLRQWERARSVRLHNVILTFSEQQLELFEAAVSLVSSKATKSPSNPNRRSNAVVEICREYIENKGKEVNA